MKTFKYILSALIIMTLSATSYAQMSSNMVMTKTEVIKVSGKCETCKARIEKAAKVAGVTKADWNVKTKLLTLVYNPMKVKSDDVQKDIALAGHDTQKYKATDKAYNSLPGCCKYR